MVFGYNNDELWDVIPGAMLKYTGALLGLGTVARNTVTDLTSMIQHYTYIVMDRNLDEAIRVEPSTSLDYFPVLIGGGAFIIGSLMVKHGDNNRQKRIVNESIKEM